MTHSEIREQIKPLGSLVLIDPILEEENTEVALPDSAKSKETGFGVIVATGDGYTYQRHNKKVKVDVEVSPGDFVVYQRYQHANLSVSDGKIIWEHAGAESNNNKKVYHLVENSNILAVEE